MTSTPSKATAGPWSAEGPDQFGDYNIHCQHERAVVAAVVNNLRRAAEVAANARLIAASPTMYDYIAAKAKDGDEDAARIIADI
jgi:hypothetical protein